MSGSSSKSPLVRIIIFTALIVVLGWCGWAMSHFGHDPGLHDLGQTVWLISPLLVSILLRLLLREGWSDFGIKLNLRGSLR